MTSLPRLADTPERLDSAGHDPDVLAASLDHVAAVNRWLGGRRAVLRHLAAWLPADGRGRVLDVGTGAGDLPRAIAEWGRRRGRRLVITAVDLHPQTVAIARRRLERWPEVRVHRADALALPYADDAFHVALMTLTLHHFDDEHAVRALRALARVARRGVLVEELERCWPNYLGSKLLAATVWRRNPITRHDGPVSARRAYTPNELLALARRAGLPGARVERHFFYRLALRAGFEHA